MAVTAIVPTQLATEVASATLPAATHCIVASATVDGWEIALGTLGVEDKLIIRVLGDASGGNVSVVAGSRPPAVQAIKGVYTFAIGASEEKFLVVDGSRHYKVGGKINVTSDDAGTKLGAFIMPAGINGGFNF